MEPLSPELALVDPELARMARDRLPPSGETPSSAGRAASSDKDVEQTSVEHSWFSDLDQGRRPENSLTATSSFAPEARSVPDSAMKGRQLRAAHRPRRRVRVVLGALGVTFAAIAVYALIPDSAVRDEAGNRAPRKASAQDLQGTQRKSARRASDSSAPTVPRRSGARAQTRTKAPRTRPFPFRVVSWPAVPDATFYKVEFFRRGREVFETLSATTRFELPTRWVYRGRTYQLVNGTYIWKVLPAYGPRSRLRYGKPIVRSTWVAQR